MKQRKGFRQSANPSGRSFIDQTKWRVFFKFAVQILILVGVGCFWGTQNVALGQGQVILTTIGTETRTNNIPATPINLTTGVSAGSSVVIAFAMNPVAGAVSAVDSVGNTYVVEADVTNGSGTTGVRTVILAAHGVIALTLPAGIAITHPAFVGARAASAISITGLAMSPLDQTSTGTGMSTTPSSGFTAATMQAEEVLFGAIGVEGPVGDVFTPGMGYNAIGKAGTTGGGAGTNITVNPEFQFVDVIGTYEANGTLATTRRWAAAITTYKVSLPTAVVLGALTARFTGRNEVQIVWNTVSEFDVAGFNVLRSEGDNQPYTQLNSALIPAQVSGTVGGARYSFTDSTVGRAGRYLYVLEMVLLDGSKQRFGPVSVQIKPQVDVKTQVFDLN